MFKFLFVNECDYTEIYADSIKEARRIARFRLGGRIELIHWY